MATTGCDICCSHSNPDPLKKSPQECVYCYSQPCMATGFGVSLIWKSSSPHPSQGPLGEKHFPHILLTCLSSGLYLHVCFQNTARYNLHNLEARHIGSVFESLHLHKNVSPFSCRHPSCSALPFQAIHRVWRAGQWQNALILHCCGWRAGWSSYSPREMLWLFLLEGRKENPTSLTLRNSFGKLDDAVTCHIG